MEWLAVYGLTTAFARITYGGAGNGFEVLVRSAHFLVPVALWIDLRSRRTGGESVVSAYEEAGLGFEPGADG